VSLLSAFPYAPTPEEVRRVQAKAKAEFCLATGVQPSEYDGLTQYEIEAFIEQHNRNQQQK